MGNCAAFEAHASASNVTDRHLSSDSDSSSCSTCDARGSTPTAIDCLSSPAVSQSGGSNTTSSKGSFFTANSKFSAGDTCEAYPPSPSLRIFSFEELKLATKNFRSDTVLGEGGSGKVFKGWIDDKGAGKNEGQTVIAVKKLSSESLQGFEEWQSELSFLGTLSHPNVVRLLGYCWEDEELLLVNESMQKGSLEHHLLGRVSAVHPLPWDLRLKIAIGGARGLAFLHESKKRPIYSNFKTSNILLDGSYMAKISDFAFAKLGPSTCHSHAAPEYVDTGRLYMKSDVYGFGVVLVEILTGKNAVDANRPKGRQILVDWIKPYLSDRRKLEDIMDSHLEGTYPSKAALQVAHLAINCLEALPKKRPSMKQVVEILERIEATNKRAKETKSRIPQFTSSKAGRNSSLSTISPS